MITYTLETTLGDKKFTCKLYPLSGMPMGNVTKYLQKLGIVLGRVDGNSSYNSMGDNWGSHQFAPVKLEFLKTYIFSPSKADTSPKQ